MSFRIKQPIKKSNTNSSKLIQHVSNKQPEPVKIKERNGKYLYKTNETHIPTKNSEEYLKNISVIPDQPKVIEIDNDSIVFDPLTNKWKIVSKQE